MAPGTRDPPITPTVPDSHTVPRCSPNCSFSSIYKQLRAVPPKTRSSPGDTGGDTPRFLAALGASPEPVDAPHQAARATKVATALHGARRDMAGWSQRQSARRMHNHGVRGRSPRSQAQKPLGADHEPHQRSGIRPCRTRGSLRPASRALRRRGPATATLVRPSRGSRNADLSSSSALDRGSRFGHGSVASVQGSRFKGW